jgi:hypothetical protein
MSTSRTNRKFARLSDTELSKFTGRTIAGLTGNADFPEPVVTTKELGTLKTTFDNAIIKADKGGNLATAQKNAARAAVLDALNKNASYVDINCNGELALLLSAGYEAASSNRAQTVLPAPQIIAVENAQSGELRARVKADPTAKSFQGRIRQASGSEFGPSISFKNSRSILFKGLTAGVTYVLELCAIGGSTGQSDWSNPVSKMAQ